jgi:hypothetical protein
MTSAVFWALLVVVVGVGIGMVAFFAGGRNQANRGTGPLSVEPNTPLLEPSAPVHPIDHTIDHPIDHTCALGGHAYRPFDTGYRCTRCGNFVASHEGELYGPAEQGRHDRRREPR